MPTKNRKYLFIFTGLNIVWILLIFALCAMPPQDIPDPGIDIPHLDKVVHIGMFFIMSLLICYRYERPALKNIYAAAIAFSFLYGGLIEILQHYFFNREGDLWDLLADVAGGILGCLLFPTVKKIEARFLHKKRAS